MPCCDDEEHSPSEFYCHGETNDPNATFQGENYAEQNNSSENVASIVFTLHFNGFILRGTFVVCQEIYIIFSKIKFFLLGYCYCFVVTATALPETASIYG